MSRCIIVAVIGALGNLLTLLAIPWAQSNRILGFNRTPLKYTTIFIVNLAFADFLYCITSLPMYSYTVKYILSENDLIYISIKLSVCEDVTVSHKYVSHRMLVTLFHVNHTPPC